MDYAIASLTDDGAEVNDYSFITRTAISPDGRYVGFLTGSQTLEPDTPDLTWEINPGFWYVKDMETGDLVRIAGETFFPNDSFGFMPNIFEMNYDVTLGAGTGLVTYAGYAASFDLATGVLGPRIELPQDDSSSFAPTARTFGSAGIVFGANRSVDLGSGGTNKRFAMIDVVTVEGGTETIEAPLKSYAGRVQGDTSLSFLENASPVAASADGRHVLIEVAVLGFRRTTVPPSTQAGTIAVDYLIHDRQTGTTRRITDTGKAAVAAFGPTTAFLTEKSIGGVKVHDLSADGRLALISTSLPLLPEDGDDLFDMFLLNTRTGKIEMLALPEGAGDGDIGGGAMSDDGRFVAFYAGWDAWLQDRRSGDVVQLNVELDPPEEAQNGFVSLRPLQITGDGSWVVFNASYRYYIEGGTNGREHVYRVENPFLAAPRPTGGNDSLTGGAGPDTIDGLAGNDTIAGLGGHDLLAGGAGADHLAGGAGNDSLTGGAGADRLEGGGGADTLSGGTGADTLLGGGGADSLAGGAGADLMEGGTGADSLGGGGGRDRLLGGAGNDGLAGGAAADTLIGGAGRDILTGGAGADRFVFLAASDSGATAAKADRITDFRHGQDRIDLSAIDALPATKRDDAFAFIGREDFHGTAGELRQTTAGLVQADLDGDGRADFTIQVNIQLLKGDFIL